MRHFLWAGQKVLSFLWFVPWPLVVWRWTITAKHVPLSKRQNFRSECLRGILYAVIIYCLTDSIGDALWMDIFFLPYFPLGKDTLKHARKLASEYTSEHLRK